MILSRETASAVCKSYRCRGGRARFPMARGQNLSGPVGRTASRPGERNSRSQHFRPAPPIGARPTVVSGGFYVYAETVVASGAPVPPPAGVERRTNFMSLPPH